MHDVVAVLSTACRFPDADTPERFFENLARGHDSFREIPADRWSIARHHDPAGRDPTRVPSRWGAFLDDPWAFDAAHFGIEPDEAPWIDPQQRLALMVASEALERGGYGGARRRALRVGTFVGVGHADHDEAILHVLGARWQAHPAAAVGSLRNIVAARIARMLDLAGPALVVDTACSSTLVAIHLARRALLDGECDLALAGGVSVHLTPSAAILLGRGGALSPTGRSRPFSASADGLVIGEGCGMLLLARERDAIERGDPVLARIRGSAVGNDGATLGPMTPRPAGQVAVMRAAWKDAGLDPASASYVEAHGTGTRVGDAVEGQSILEVFGARPFLVGSAKGNVGHLLAAAGATGVLKVIESLRARVIPPSLHASPLSPKLPFERAGIEVPSAATAWEGSTRRAAVNGFGFGGTNAHLVLEEAASIRPRHAAPGPDEVLLSAASPHALRALCAALAERLRATPESEWPALLHHATHARAHRAHRAAAVGRHRLVERLDALARGERAVGAWIGVATEGPFPTDLSEAERFVRGASPSLPDDEPAFVRSPTTPLSPSSYRLREPDDAGGAPRDDAGGLLQRVHASLDHARVEGTIAPDDPLVAHHRVLGRDVIPAAGITEILRAAMAAACDRDVRSLDDVAFRTSIAVERARALSVEVRREAAVIVASLRSPEGTELASAREGGRASGRRVPPLPTDARALEPGALYARLASRGMTHGPYYQALTRLDVRGSEAWADLALPPAASARSGAFVLHPSLLDAALQPVAAVLLEHADADEGLFVPLHVERVRIEGTLGTRARVHVTLHGDPARPGDAVRCDATLAFEGGSIELDGAVLARASAARMHGQGAWLHAVRWVPEARTPAASPARVALHAPAELREALARALGARGVAIDEAAREIVVVTPSHGLARLLEAHEPDPAEIDRAVDAGVLPLWSLARAVPAGARLVVITRGAACVQQGEEVDPLASATFALAHALADEGLASSAIDLALDATPDQIAEAFLAEVGAPPSIGAWRGGVRYARTVEPTLGEPPLEREPGTSARIFDPGSASYVGSRVRPGHTRIELPSGRTSPLREDGVYLVTGGARGIGLEVARSLAGERRTVIVTSRSPTEVPGLRHVVSDVGAPRALDALVATILREHGALHGVVHAAGVVRPARLGDRTDAMVREVLRPKVHGALALLGALRTHDVRPDFVVLFSSISASLPGLGGTLSDYAAANGFLDGLARASSPTLHVRALAWSNWAETGMGVDPTLVRMLEERGLPSWSSADGVRAFHAALALGAPHVVVARFARKAALVAKAEPGEGLVEVLRTMVASALGVPASAVPADAPLSRLGLDSLVAIELAKALESKVGRALPTTLFFDHDTIEKIAAAIGVPDAPTTAYGPAPSRRPFALTRAFTLQQRLDPGATAISLVRLTLERAPDEARLRDALASLVARHPMLRVRIDGRGGDVAISLDRPEREGFELSLAPEPGDVERAIDAWVGRSFDLAQGPLLRVLAAGPHVVLCAHHAVADAWSMHVLAEELVDALAEIPLPPAPPVDVVVRAHEIPAATEEDVSFFAETLREPSSSLGLEASPMRGLRTEHRVVVAASVLSARARDAGLTTFHVVAAAYARALAEATGASRVAIAVARARRDARIEGLDRVVGCLADTLPLVLDVDPAAPLEVLGAQVRERWRMVEAHATPTSLDLAHLAPEGRAPRALAEASLSLARFPLAGRPGVREVRGRTATAATGLGLAAYEDSGALVLSMTTPIGRVPEALARAVLARTAAALAGEPAAAALAIVNAASQAEAIVGGPTHAELAGSAARIAGLLASRGIEAGACVAILGEPGAATIATMLGVLRAGAAWIALDPADPPPWQVALAARAGARLVLADRDVVLGGLEVVPIALALEGTPSAPAAPGAIAYVAATSGSSGPPKLVPIPRAALARYLDWLVLGLGYRASDRCLGLAPLVFDASLRQLLGPLAAGASLVPAPRALARDPDAVLDAIDAHAITILSTVPSMLARIAAAADRRPGTGTSLRMVQSGGEALSVALARRLARAFPSAVLVNLYGPTEATINVACHVVDDVTLADREGEGRVPIGRAIAGALLSVRREGGERAREGELWIGGAALSAGYLGDEERTARAFPTEGGRRWYRTGDRARVRDDGSVDLLGRLDDQVKIRGRRVDPGDVERAIGELPGVVAAAVRAEGGEDAHLVAWVVADDPRVDERVIAVQLAARLPSGLVPRRIHLVSALPTGRAGKTDRAALRAPDVAPGEPSSGSIESQVRTAFAEILGRADIGLDDDFFASGGDSIAALTLFDRLGATLGALPRPAVLYDARTPRALAARLAIEIDAAPASPSPAPEAELPLSPAQRGFLAAHARGAAIGWSARVPIEGPLDPRALDRALEIVAARHPMLRARFVREGSGWRAMIDPTLPLVIGRGVVDAGPFDLSAPRPLVRLALGLRADGRHEIAVVADHLVGDAISGTLLAAELMAAHDALARGTSPSLPPIGATFADLARDALRQAAEPERHAYVRRTFAAPYLGPRSRHSATSGSTRCELVLGEGETEALVRSARAHGRSLFESLFATFVRACAALADARDVVVGTALSGRDDPRALRVFGPLVTMMPVRVTLDGDVDADARTAIEALRAARTHALPVGELLRHLPPGTAPADATGEAFFVTYVDVDALAPAGSGLVLRWDEADVDATVPEGCDLHLSARRVRGTLRLVLTAAARVIDRPGLERLASSFRDALVPRVSRTSPDAVLVGYLPAPADLARSLPGTSAEALGAGLRAAGFAGGAPRVFETVETPLGRADFVVLPRFADELDAPGLEGEIASALALAERLGARGASLAGMLPAHVGYGRGLARSPSPVLTTGHATTATSIVLTLEHALVRLEASWAAARVAFVGLGSVGGAACELALETLGAPREVVLCDLARAEARTSTLAERLVRAGVKDVRVAHATPRLPEGALACDVIVAASSGGAVLDPSALAPGTLVLDDSFPPVLDVDAALARMRARRDAVFSGAGLIDAGPTRRTLSLPPELEPLRARIEAARPHVGLPSCMLEPLVRHARPELPATIGLVELPLARAYLAAARALGLRAAPLHLGGQPIEDDVVEGTRRARLDRAARA